MGALAVPADARIPGRVESLECIPALVWFVGVPGKPSPRQVTPVVASSLTREILLGGSPLVKTKANSGPCNKEGEACDPDEEE